MRGTFHLVCRRNKNKRLMTPAAGRAGRREKKKAAAVVFLQHPIERRCEKEKELTVIFLQVPVERQITSTAALFFFLRCRWSGTCKKITVNIYSFFASPLDRHLEEDHCRCLFFSRRRSIGFCKKITAPVFFFFASPLDRHLLGNHREYIFFRVAARPASVKNPIAKKTHGH